MVSPLAWSHYQIMLAPLLVVLVVDFAHRRPAAAVWLTAVVGYLLCELVWRPNGTLPGALAHMFSNAPAETLTTEYAIFAYAAWAQYFLLLGAIVYYGAVTRGVLAGPVEGDDARLGAEDRTAG
jgi:hypothetical protein